MDEEPKPISRLPESVVNRIAAGEVIQRPANAVKELLENSIDAGATQITITVKDGGIKLLQIQDNGHGVRKEDMPILCERHTTSKLHTFDQLSDIHTLGFRGEALASISYISHLTVSTMTSTDKTHGWKGTYTDGALVGGSVKPCAATRGTIIVAEDLFYNVPLRRKALKSANEEYNAILDVVGRYAVYHAGAALTVKRVGEARADLSTMTGSTRIDTLRTVYGAAVAKNALPLTVKRGTYCSNTSDHENGAPTTNNTNNQNQGREETAAAGGDLSCEVQGFVSGAEYSGKRTQLVLFINGRAVDCTPLKRTLEAMYTTLLPKATKPFFFLDIKLPGSHVDVNVHPTKKEVAFLHQEDLIDTIRQACEETLLASNATRTFTQALLPGVQLPIHQQPGGGSGSGVEKQQPAYYRPDKLVRTDAKIQTLHAFLDPSATPATTGTQTLGGGGGGMEGIEEQQHEQAAHEEDVTVQEAEERQPTALDNNDGGAYNDMNTTTSLAAAALGAVPRRKRGANVYNATDNTLNGGDFSFMPTAMEITGHGDGGTDNNNNNALTNNTQQQQQQQTTNTQTDTMAITGTQLQRPVRHNTNIGSSDSRIQSIQRLLADSEKQPHQGLKDILQSPTYVGMADSTNGILQHGTRLYLANMMELTRDMFYQQTLRRFGQAGKIRLEPPPCVYDLAMVALEAQEVAGHWKDSEEGGTKEEVAQLLSALLIKKSPILSECFSIDVDPQGHLTALPQLIEQYIPDMDFLPSLILSLGRNVEWSEESACFKGIAEELGQFYKLQRGVDPGELDAVYDGSSNNLVSTSQQQLEGGGQSQLENNGSLEGDKREALQKERENREWSVQHVLIPALRLFLVPGKQRAGDGTVVELTRLENLYRVFERC